MDLFRVFQKQADTKVKNPINVFYYVLTVCMSLFYNGYTLIYISAINFNVIAEDFKIDFSKSVAQGIFQGIVPIGGAVGCLSSAYFLQTFSRKNLLYFSNTLAIILILLSLIPNYKIFFVARFFQGFLSGLNSAVVPVIVKQNSPADMINITGAFINLSIIVGLFFVYFFGFILASITGDWAGASYWHIVFMFPLLTIGAQLLLLWFVYPFQTPKYLAQLGKKEQVKTLLRQFYKQEYVQEMYEQVMKQYGPSVQAKAKDEYSQVVDSEPSHGQSKCALIYGVFYAFLCPMVGINVMLSYGGQAASKVAPGLAPIMPSILMFLLLVFSTISIVFVNKYGRKQLTIYGTFSIVSILYLISYGYFISQSKPALAQTIIVIAFMLYLFAYGLTYAPVMWIWVAQAVQPNNIGYAVMVNWAGAALVMIVFPIALQHLPGHNPGYAFLFFATYGLLSLFVTNKFMIQTKDKKEHEIFQAYKELDRQLFGKTEEKKDYQLGLIKNAVKT